MRIYIYARAYARSIVYARMQFAQTNGLTMRTRVYIINANNVMPKLYLYTYVHAYARTYAHAVDRKQYSQTNANKHTQTNANKRTQTHRCVRRVGDFCRQTRLRFCALDLKLSGCTIRMYWYVQYVYGTLYV